MRHTKRWRGLLAVCVGGAVLAGSMCAPVGAAGKNLLTNGGFENGFSGWEVYMDEASVALSSTEKHDGKNAVKLNGIGEEGEEHWNKLRQSFDVTPNTVYTVSGWAKITGAPIDTWKSKIEIEDADYQPFVTLRIHDMGTKPTGDWQAFSFDFNSEDNDFVRLSLCADNGGKNNVHYYDDLTVTASDKTAAPVNGEQPGGTSAGAGAAFTNGGFESDLDGWNVFADNGSLTVTTDERHSGEKSIKVNGVDNTAADIWNVMRQAVSVSPNTDYVVSGWAKITGAPIDTWKSKIEIEDSANTPFVTKRFHDMGEKPTGDWQAFSFTFNTGDNDEIYLTLGADNGGTGNIHYYDDFDIQPKSGAVPPPNAAVSGTNIIKNGSFENGETGWESGWTQSEAIVSDDKTDGSKSLRITDCRWESNVHQFITVKPNTDYVISFQARVAREEDEWSSLVKVGENDVTLEELGKVNMRKSDGWKKYSFEISTGDLTEVCLMIMGNVSEFYVDDVQMYAKGGEGAGETDTPGTQDTPKTFLDTLRGTKADTIRLVINDKLIETDQPPLIVNGRVLVPVRALCEALGAKVGWNGQLHKTVVSMGGQFIVLTVGDMTAYVNDAPVGMDTAPAMAGDRVLIPVRFVSETFNTAVEWLDGERIVAVTSK